MPFKSYKQLAYLKANEPEVYKRWKRKYGTKIRGDGKKRGTIRRRKKKRFIN